MEIVVARVFVFAFIGFFSACYISVFVDWDFIFSFLNISLL